MKSDFWSTEDAIVNKKHFFKAGRGQTANTKYGSVINLLMTNA